MALIIEIPMGHGVAYVKVLTAKYKLTVQAIPTTPQNIKKRSFIGKVLLV